MYIFYFIFCLVAFVLQLVSGAWLMKCFPFISARDPFLVSLLGSVLMFMGFTYTHTHQTDIFSGALYYVAYIWFGLSFLAFCICVCFVVVWQLLTWLHLPTAWMGTATLLTMAVVFTMAIWGGFSEPKIKHIAVKIPGAPKMKLALLADTHLGMGVSLDRFDRVMHRIEAERPDGILVLGDIFEYGPHRSAYAARIKQAKTPLGTYGVLGNHEYYTGYGDSKAFFEQAGITLLENTAVTLSNGVQVAGLKDIKTTGVTAKQVAKLLDGLHKHKPIILLSHTPLLEDVAAEHGANLMLSGHTHNGQLWPFTYLVKLVFPHVYGLYEINKMKLYVTSGIFYWGMPLRFLAPAEIAFIEVNP